MEDLKIYHRSYYDTDDITSALLAISGAPNESREELENAVYYLKAAAQNEYNNDSFRVIYNIMLMIAEKNA